MWHGYICGMNVQISKPNMTHWWLFTGCWFTTNYVRYRFHIESKQTKYNQILLTLIMFRLRIYLIPFITWEIIFRLFWWKLIKNNTHKHRLDFKHFVSNGNWRFFEICGNFIWETLRKHLGNSSQPFISVNFIQASILVNFRQTFVLNNSGYVKIC